MSEKSGSNIVHNIFPARIGAGDGLASGGDGPHDPGMEARVTALETDMRAVRSSLDRIESKLENLATRVDVATVAGSITTLTERVSGQSRRLDLVEVAIGDTVKSALSKTIGPWQLPGVLLASGFVIIALVGAVNWAVHQPWFPH